MGYFIKKDKHGNEGLVVPSGSSADRPATPIEAVMRYNTDTNSMEYFNGTQFVQFAKTGSANLRLTQFTGDGVASLFTPMVQTVAESRYVMVFINGVYQTPGTHYTVSGFDITFTSPPPLNESIVIIHNLDSTSVTNGNVF